jgi:chaperonin cofactor prefoldin
MTQEDLLVRHDVEITTLKANFEKQNKKLDDILSELNELTSYNVEVSRKVNSTVFGNGHPGLVKDMEQLKERSELRQHAHDTDMNGVFEHLKLQQTAHDKDVAHILKQLQDQQTSHDKDIRRINNILCWGGITLFGVMSSTIGYMLYVIVQHLTK